MRRRRLVRWWPVPLLDAVLAVALVVWGVLSEADLAGPRTARPWDSVAAAVWVSALLFRSTAPLAMAAVASAGAVGFAVTPGVPDWAPFEASLVIGFSLGLQLRGRRLLVAAGAVMASTYLEGLATEPFHGVVDTYLSVPLILGGAIAAGMVLRRSRQQTARLRQLREELVAEREARARDAAAAERNRVARDLHDVISHSVGAMVVQAGAAVAQLPVDSPARAQLEAVRATGKQTLSELRRQLGVLRQGSVGEGSAVDR